MSALQDLRVIARARELGIKGPEAFGRRYGRRIQDLSPQKALDIMNGVKEPPTADFPDRLASIYTDQRSREEIKDEMRKFREWQINEIRRLWYREDESSGYASYPVGYAPPGTDIDGEEPRQQRPVFGNPIG